MPTCSPDVPVESLEETVARIKAIEHPYSRLIEITALFDKDAAKFLDEEAMFLLCFNPEDNIDFSFRWCDTRQGSRYWNHLYTKTEAWKREHL